MPLDGNVADKVGTYSTSQKDRLDYVSGYYGQGADVKAGSILTDFNPGTGSFSVSCWVKFTAKPDDPCIFSNKDWSKGTNKGFVLSYRGDDIKFNAGNGSSRNDFEFSLPQDFMNGWMFLVFVVDRNAGTIGLSLDFSYIKTFQLTGALRSATFNGLGGLVFGQDGTGYYASLPAIMDEVAIYNKALTSAEIASLKEYYNAQRVY